MRSLPRQNRALLFVFGLTGLLVLSRPGLADEQTNAQGSDIAFQPSAARCCEPTAVTVYRPQMTAVTRQVLHPVWTEEPTTVFRNVTETRWKEETVTVMRPVTETVQREQVCYVSRPVRETVEIERTWVSLRPVWKQEFRETTSLVSEPVTEYVQRQVCRTVMKPVTQTVQRTRVVTVMRPETCMKQVPVQTGGWVTRCRTIRGAVVPQVVWGLYGPGIAPVQLPARTVEERVWQPAVEWRQVSVTRLVPQRVVQSIPIQVTRMVQESLRSSFQRALWKNVSGNLLWSGGRYR